MQIFERCFVSIILLACLVSPAAAADPTGEWLVAEGTARIRIEPCGDALWGVISWSKEPGKDENNPDPAKRDRSIIGMPILLKMKKVEFEPLGRRSLQCGKWQDLYVSYRPCQRRCLADRGLRPCRVFLRWRKLDALHLCDRPPQARPKAERCLPVSLTHCCSYHAAGPSEPAEIALLQPSCTPVTRPAICPCSMSPDGSRATGCRTPSPLSGR